jgi:hypothetical protein
MFKIHLVDGIMEQLLKLLNTKTIANLSKLHLKFMIKMEIRVIKKESFMDSQINNKYLM